VLLGAGVLALVGRRRFLARVWGVALLTLASADLASGGAVRDAVAGVLLDWSVAQRAALMLAGVRLFLENPLVGVGPGGFAEELERVGVLVPELWDLQPTPHNAYIQAAAETGLIGLAAFVVFLAVIFRRLLALARSPAPSPVEESLRVALLWSFAIALVEGMFEWPLSHGHGQVVMLVAAAGIALSAPAAPFAEVGRELSTRAGPAGENGPDPSPGVAP
jgi:O-antigen ligase